MAHHPEKKTLQAYVIGFILCAFLTLVSFGMVEKKLFSEMTLIALLLVLALVQLTVQSICFLNLNNSSEGKWNLQPFLFTLLIIVVLVTGSLWIMNNLDYNMYN